MQQRRLRLGDILDDYCPRERRITNHAVVAMIEDAVKQTRCTTCDADHEYKQARVPTRRKKDGGALAGELAAGPRPRAAATPVEDPHDQELEDTLIDDDVSEAAVAEEALPSSTLHAAAPAHEDRIVEPEIEPEPEIEEPRREEDGPVHRRLIRATLPRPEGQAPEWKDPEFTVRQPGGRGGFDGNRNGHRPGGRPGGAGPGGGRPRTARGHGGPAHGDSQARFGGPRQGNMRHGSGAQNGQGGNRGGRPGQGQGQGPGQRNGQRPQGGHGRKRGR
jgi:hypothetical protein